ncbi:MAG TPA: hypothetical protein VEM40_02900 [Nitrospirota bacterium]|nr:hypothetical protein [Nitrospirota bacterium]
MKKILSIVMVAVVTLALGFTFAEAKAWSDNGITYFDKDSGSKIEAASLDMVVANGITVTEPVLMAHFEASSSAAGGLREEKPDKDLYNGITVFKE